MTEEKGFFYIVKQMIIYIVKTICKQKKQLFIKRQRRKVIMLHLIKRPRLWIVNISFSVFGKHTYCLYLIDTLYFLYKYLRRDLYKASEEQRPKKMIAKMKKKKINFCC